MKVLRKRLPSHFLENEFIRLLLGNAVCLFDLPRCRHDAPVKSAIDQDLF